MATLFEAYVTNAGKYSEGQLVGETLKFPTTAQEVEALLKRIGVDGVRYQEIFITSFDGDVLGLYDHLSEYENLDELNHLACLLSELTPSELETLEAVLDSGDHCSSVRDIINLTQNLDCYGFYPGVSDEETLGRIYVDDLEMLDVPDQVKPYFDYEAYGRDACIHENGHFAPGGYVVKESDHFVEVYHGLQDIPKEHILDPIQAYMGDKADMNKANEVRPIFRRLAEVAERTGCAVILIGHLNKAAGGQSAYRGLGSIDFRAAARSVLLIGRVKREPNVRVIVHDKSSLAPEGKPVAFCLDPETGFSWIGEYDITADELLSGAGGNTATKTEQAEKLILDLLADGKELASEEIVKAAAEAGISERTVQNAKRNMGGILGARRVGGQWYNFIKKKQPPETAS